AFCINGLRRDFSLEPKVRAQCGNSARWDPCGGCRVTGIPTATKTFRENALADGVEFPKEEAIEFRRVFFEMYPGIELWHRDIGLQLRESTERSYIKKIKKTEPAIRVRTISGRVMKAAGYCAALNYAVQGSGADMLKLATIKVGRELRAKALQTKIIHLVHDDIRLLCPDSEVEQIVSILNSCMGSVADQMMPKFSTLPEITRISSE
ncbi:MAG: hypothetical protein HQM09_25035, partial [Candidatus Riflebacteria bacterium]|nr:hypothetical protein [Candidatus Riflebacteria bacterium]